VEQLPASPVEAGTAEIVAETREAQNTGLAANSVDLFTSTGVLEYIPGPVLKEILAECRRVGKPVPCRAIT